MLELEGNQRSWLVKDQLNDALTTLTDSIEHSQSKDKNYNRVVTERHRVVITPSSQSGEYMADLLPVRYKVVEVSAQGHPSLFQKGKVSEILDLTDSLTTKQSAYAGSPTGGTWTGTQTRAYTTFLIPTTTIPIGGYHHTYPTTATSWWPQPASRATSGPSTRPLTTI